MFKPLRKERKPGGNKDVTTNVEEKVIRLKGIDFHKQDVMAKIRESYTPENIPQKSESYNVNMKSLRKPKKKLNKVNEDEIPVTYNDFSMYFCNFENEVMKTQSHDLVDKVKQFKKNVQYLMDEEQEN